MKQAVLLIQVPAKLKFVIEVKVEKKDAELGQNAELARIVRDLDRHLFVAHCNWRRLGGKLLMHDSGSMWSALTYMPHEFRDVKQISDGTLDVDGSSMDRNFNR